MSISSLFEIYTILQNAGYNQIFYSFFRQGVCEISYCKEISLIFCNLPISSNQVY